MKITNKVTVTDLFGKIYAKTAVIILNFYF